MRNPSDSSSRSLESLNDKGKKTASPSPRVMTKSDVMGKLKKFIQMKADGSFIAPKLKDTNVTISQLKLNQSEVQTIKEELAVFKKKTYR